LGVVDLETDRNQVEDPDEPFGGIAAQNRNAGLIVAVLSGRIALRVGQTCQARPRHSCFHDTQKNRPSQTGPSLTERGKKNFIFGRFCDTLGANFTTLKHS
jgi:hypothetical protein